MAVATEVSFENGDRIAVKDDCKRLQVRSGRPVLQGGFFIGLDPTMPGRAVVVWDGRLCIDTIHVGNLVHLAPEGSN